MTQKKFPVEVRQDGTFDFGLPKKKIEEKGCTCECPSCEEGNHQRCKHNCKEH